MRAEPDDVDRRLPDTSGASEAILQRLVAADVEILESPALAEEFATGSFTPAIAISRPGRVARKLASRVRNALFVSVSPLL